MNQITKTQLYEIEETAIMGLQEYNKKLEEVTGIVAKPYTGYSYYDCDGNYIGDSFTSDTTDLLKNAYIEVILDE